MGITYLNGYKIITYSLNNTLVESATLSEALKRMVY